MYRFGNRTNGWGSCWGYLTVQYLSNHAMWTQPYPGMRLFHQQVTHKSQRVAAWKPKWNRSMVPNQSKNGCALLVWILVVAILLLPKIDWQLGSESQLVTTTCITNHGCHWLPVVFVSSSVVDEPNRDQQLVPSSLIYTPTPRPEGHRWPATCEKDRRRWPSLFPFPDRVVPNDSVAVGCGFPPAEQPLGVPIRELPWITNRSTGLWVLYHELIWVLLRHH